MLFVLLECFVVMALHRHLAHLEFIVQLGLRQRLLVLLDTRARPNQLLLNALQVSMLNLVSSFQNVTLVLPTLSALSLLQLLDLFAFLVLCLPIQHLARRHAWHWYGPNSKSPPPSLAALLVLLQTTQRQWLLSEDGTRPTLSL